MENKDIVKRDFYTHEDSGKAFLFALLAMLFVSAITSIIPGKVGIYITMVLTPLSLIATFFIFNSYNGISFSASKVNPKIGVKNYFVVIITIIVALLGIELVISCFDKLWSLIGYNPKSEMIMPTNTLNYIFDIFAVALLPAIGEELIFRGIIFQGLRKNRSDVFAIFISALLFALYHGSLQQLIYPFILGSIFALLAFRTGSIVSSMVAHFINNLLVLTFSFVYNMTGVNIGGYVNTWWFILLAILLFIFTLIFIYLIDRFVFKSKNTNDVEKEYCKSLSPFVYVALGLGLVLTVVGTLITFLV